MLHKIRFETKDCSTRVFLDDQEVHGCIKANIDYAIECLPVVQLTLNATEIEVEADSADIWKLRQIRPISARFSEEPIATLNLSVGTINILRNGVWYNKKKERQVDPVLTIGKLLQEYKAGRIMKYKGLGPHRLCEITNALKERGLI